MGRIDTIAVSTVSGPYTETVSIEGGLCTISVQATAFLEAPGSSADRRPVGSPAA